MTRKPRKWRRPSVSAPVTFWWAPNRKHKTSQQAEQRRGFCFAGQAVQPRRIQGLWWRSGLLHGARNGGGILDGSLRPEGWRNLAAGEDRFRLAHHQAGRPERWARPSPMIRSSRHPQRAAAPQGAGDDGQDPCGLEGRDRRRGSQEYAEDAAKAAKNFQDKQTARPVKASSRLQRAARRRRPPARAISNFSSSVHRPGKRGGCRWDIRFRHWRRSAFPSFRRSRRAPGNGRNRHSLQEPSGCVAGGHGSGHYCGRMLHQVQVAVSPG